MIDYSKYSTTLAEPEASSMLQTFRAIGYSVEAAIADIIDNSISADAKNIWIAVESVYSMDGDIADISGVLEIIKYNENIFLSCFHKNGISKKYHNLKIEHLLN